MIYYYVFYYREYLEKFQLWASYRFDCQAEKVRLFNNQSTLVHILKAKHPKEAKEIGKKIISFDETIYMQHRFAVVANANIARIKFFGICVNGCARPH